MRIEIPVLVQSFGRSAGQPPLFVARTVFFGPMEERHEQLERAVSTLTANVRRYFRTCGNDLRHHELSGHLFSPELAIRRLDVRIDLRKQTARGKMLVALLKGLDRQLAFSPLIPDLWFEVPHSSGLVPRVQEVLSQHFQRIERETGGEVIFSVQRLFMAQSEWLTTLDFQLETSQRRPAPQPTRFALMPENKDPDGDEELERVGRPLLDLYPDDLDRAVLRDEAVEELTGLLNSTDGRPVLLLGPRGVGKTTLIHEFAWRRGAARGRHHQLNDGIWLLSPQRLISGMSFVGQWEARLLAILKTAQKRRHLLYFDDLLGLFQAGKSAQSNLCVADVLKPFMERRDVRVIAETTPESWRVLRERDRSLSDLFRVLPINEPTEAESLRILLAVVMQLEGRHRCRIQIDALPAVLDLQRRYVRDAVMPGKAAAFLRRLAAKYAGQEVSRENVLREFQAQSGLSMSFLDSRAKLSREEVLKGLRQRVIGQVQALSAVTDATVLAKARLNDPDRPLAALLFLGPTGVGKTQTAKSLAAYLYGDVDRLVRFDMNEFVSVNAVSQLVGTFDEPDGLLTGAIRRQPYAVVLLDEIEKAHSSVIDLLLQVLGEGRLTDAVGRTTDFTNTIIILTSNLGVRRAEVGLGFDPPRVDDAHSYLTAAENYFRPEFFNRLDRVVPFSRLEKEDVRRIADLLLHDMLRREGLRRRRCALSIEPLAVDRMVDLAYDPILGARALRRGLERQVVRDVAEQLVTGLPDAPTIIHVYPAPRGVQVQLVPLHNAEPWELSVGSDAGEIQLPRIREWLRDMEATCDALRPKGGFQVGQIGPAHQHYLSLRERLDRAKGLLQQITARREAPRRSATASTQTTDRGLRYGKRVFNSFRLSSVPKRNMGAELAATQDLHAYFQELQDQGEKVIDSPEEDIEAELIRELGLLRMLSESDPITDSQSSVLLLEGVGDTDGSVTKMVSFAVQQAYCRWGLVHAQTIADDSLPQNHQAIRLDGPCADRLADIEVGTHLVCPPGLGFVAIRARRVSLPAECGVHEFLQNEKRDRNAWLCDVAAGSQIPDADPEAWPSVVRIYDSTGFVFDVRLNTLTPDAVPSFLASTVGSKLQAAAIPPEGPLIRAIRQSMFAALRVATLSWLEKR